MTTTRYSLESATHKFNGTKPYRQLPHHFSLNYEETTSLLQSSPEEAFLCICGKWTDDLKFENASLVEMVQYDDGYSHLFFLKRSGTSLEIKIPREPSTEEIKGISFSFICTDNEPYISLLKGAIEHYQNLELDVPVEVNVTFFGNAPDLGPGVKVTTEPRDKFDMAYARNQGMKNCLYDHIFMLDVDVILSKHHVNSILKKFKTIPNHGVFNLKNTPQVGNGLYFGRRDVLLQNGYNEEFKKFWYEDTEYLMNFSRIGIIPIVVFEPFERVDHTRGGTTSSSQLNFNLFSNILHRGHR